MAGAPIWKVYDPNGTYQAACKEGEAAAALVALYGDGSTVRYRHRRLVWTEGKEECPAGESYDTAARTMAARAKGGTL